MNKVIALTLLLGIPIAFQSPAAAKDAEGDGKKILLKFERYGGFAGFHDNLTIYSDFSFDLGTPPHVKHHFRGRLTDGQIKELTELLKGFGGDFLKEHTDGPKIADGMRTRLEVHGTGDAAAKGDERSLNRLLHQITTAARAGEKAPK